LPQQDLSSFLKIGDSTAIFRSSGKMPDTIDSLKIIVSDLLITPAASFINFGGIWS
jgi:hypothetical protein